MLEQVVFTSFAGDRGDFICVSWRDTPDAPGKVIADQINVLSGDEKAKFCLQFVVKHIENIFFDPAWFEGLNQGQRDLLDSLAFDGVDGLGAPPIVALKPEIEFVLPQSICSTWVGTPIGKINPNGSFGGELEISRMTDIGAQSRHSIRLRWQGEHWCPY